MPSARSLGLEVLEVLILALGIYLVISFTVETVHVIGISMETTLSTDDYVIASKIDYRLHSPQRGDIVILHTSFGEKDLIKRVIALPGERLLVKNAHVYINGKLLDEPYASRGDPWTVNTNWPNAGSTTGALIPPNEYFVMGDNRSNSSDSRIFGPVTRDEIEAKAVLRIWPLGRFGPITSAPTLQAAIDPFDLGVLVPA